MCSDVAEEPRRDIQGANKIGYSTGAFDPQGPDKHAPGEVVQGE